MFREGARKFGHPLIFLPALAILGGFGFSLFFEGYRDIIYAPAILCLVAAALTACLPALWSAAHVPRALPALLLLTFCTYVTLSLTWSTVPYASLVTWLVFLSLPLVFFSLLIPAQNNLLLAAAGSSLAAAVGVLALWAVVQAGLGYITHGEPRAGGPLPNPNNLATILNMGLLSFMALTLGIKNRGRSFYAALALTLIVFAGLLSTQSRGGFRCFAVAAAALVLVLRPPRVHVLILGGALAALALIASLSVTEFGSRLAELATPAQDPNVTSRLVLWKAALALIAEHPWRGTGLGTFYLYYPPHRPPLIDNSGGFWVHMDPLQYGVEMGIIAPMLFYFFLAAVLERTVRALRQAPSGTKERTVIAGSFCALLAAILHAHICFPLYTMPVLILCGVILAAWYKATGAVMPAGSFLSLPTEGAQKFVTSTALLCTAAMISFSAFSSAAGQFFLTRGIDHIKAGQISAFMNDIQNAANWGPATFIDPDVQLAGFYLDILSGTPDALFSKEEQMKMRDTAFDLLGRAESLNPAWAEIDYKRARLYETMNDDEKAFGALEKALAKNPQHFRAREDYARALIAHGWPAEAYDILARGREWPHAQDVENRYKKLMSEITALSTLQKQRQKQDLAGQE